MRNLLFLLFFIMGRLSFCYGQSGDSLAADMNSFLPSGRYTARMFAIATGGLTPQEQELENKVTKAMMAHADLLRDSLKEFADPGQLYARLGLTTEDMEAYGQIESKREKHLRRTETDSLEILPQGNLIRFRGSGGLQPLDSLQIDPGAKKAIFRRQEMSFKNREDNSDTANAFGSGSVTDQFVSEEAADDTKNISEMLSNLRQFTLGVGRLKKTGETMVFLMAIQYVDKRPVLNVTKMFLVDTDSR